MRDVTRRWLLTGALAGAAALAGATLDWREEAGSRPGGLLRVAHAGEDACDGDPVLSIDGAIVQIRFRVPMSAMAWITATHPLVTRVSIPNDVAEASVVAYTGEIPERVDWVRQKGVVKGKDKFTITYSVYAPPRDPHKRYQLLYEATSAIDAKSHNFVSGHWQGGSILVPRVR